MKKSSPESYFEILSPQTAAPLTQRDVECILLPLSESKNLAQSLDLGSSRWTDASREQFKEKHKKLQEEIKSGGSVKARTVRVWFDGGGEVRVLLLPESLKTYALHSELRKQVSELFKRQRNETIRFNLLHLESSLATEALGALASLSRLTAWTAPEYGKRALQTSESGHPERRRFEALCMLDAATAESVVVQGTKLANATNLVRTLADTPSNFLHPDSYLDLIRERARSRKYAVEYLDVKKLKARKAGAFLAVIQGSVDQRGGIVHLTYTPRSSAVSHSNRAVNRSMGVKKVDPSPKLKASKGVLKRVVLVGKGLCFDTGGNNIKTGNFMNGMHRDMTGSAVALALFEYLAEMNVPYELHALLALAENVVSPDAFRPNDVVIASDGTSIEVVNTDAEGRMVLSDTLVEARKLKPDLVLDFATLTGSAVRAIGTTRCAVFSNHDRLRSLAVEVGEICGERVWSFPIGDDYVDQLKSDFADTLQCAVSAPADHILAATFLSKFIGDETPWLHCDLSADTHKGGLGLVDSETTGFGVRFGSRLIADFFSN